MRDPIHIPFADYAAAELARSGARPQTIDGYRTQLAHILPRLGAIPVGKIRREHVLEALVEARDAGLAPKSVYNILLVVRMILRSAGVRAADGLKVGVPDADVRPLGREEAGRLRHALDPKIYADAAVLALLGTGLRLGELERLRRQDWDGQTLRIASLPGAPTKSGRGRLVDVASWAHEAVETLLARPRSPLARNTLRRHLAARCREARVPEIRIHDLRHTRATLLLLVGVPLLYVSQQLGHHDPGFTLRVYGHLIAATKEDRLRWADA